MVRMKMMMMVVVTKYGGGGNAGSLKNKAHFLNRSQGSTAS